MEHRNHDNLRALFERFMEPAQAEAAARDVREADELFQAHPVPKPRDEMVVGIKLQIATRLSTQPKATHPFRRLLAAAAAVIVIATLAFWGRAPQQGPAVSHAALIPATIWDSDDISVDDMDIAYFASEIRHIEAQVMALETGRTEDVRVATLHEVETELMQIDTEFWKE